MSEQRMPYQVTYSATAVDLSEAAVTLVVSPQWARLLNRLQQAMNAGASGAWVDLDAVTVSVAPQTELLTRR